MIDYILHYLDSMDIKYNRYISVFLVLCIVSFLSFFLTHETFLAWTFNRHQNILSWYIRPVLIFPFCYFAYKRNINGILLSVLAIFTSMFWFPAPEIVSEQVQWFLSWEREYLLSPMTVWKAFFYFIVIAYFILLAKAFWARSIQIWALVIFFAIIGKAFGSILMNPEYGYVVIPICITAAIISLFALRYYKKCSKKDWN